jgi:hypothetical protein
VVIFFVVKPLQVTSLLQAEITKQGYQMSVRAREGFAYHSVKLVD